MSDDYEREAVDAFFAQEPVRDPHVQAANVPDWWAAAEERQRNGTSMLNPNVDFRTPKQKREDLELLGKISEDSRRAEEAKLAAAELKAGGAVSNRDSEFSFRVPRDVLRTAAPPPYDFEDVPPFIGDFARQYSLATGYDPSGVLVACVTAAASVIDDGYKLTLRAESDWHVSARQWSFLCGFPSAGKSPCIRAATDPIKRMHGILYDRWREVNEGLRRDEQAPIPALYSSDATIAALSERLRGNPRGLLMLTEEFASWVGGIDAADKGEASKNRGDWLQLRDGGPHQIDRVERGSVYVPNWGVSVLAACTPDGLAKQMKWMPEDGLIQRFIPCILGNPDLNAVGDARQVMAAWGRALEWIWQHTTSPYPRYLNFTAEARALFDTEVRELRKLVMATEEFAPAYASHLGKHPGMLGEVALIFHVLLSGAGGLGKEVGVEPVQYATRYLRKARRHAYTLYSSVLSSAPAFTLARALARSIVASEEAITTINRDWMTQHCQAFKKADDRLRREAVQILEDADWLSAQTHVRSYGGWPRAYAVHPRVFEIFAREGEQWRARRAAVRDAIGEGS